MAVTTERINIDMSITDAVLALCDGNPGGLTVCADLLKSAERINPDGGLGGLGILLLLDSLNIYGSRIWGLYKDVAKQNLGKTVALLLAWQLGHLAGVTKEVLHNAIENRGAGIDLNAVVKAVKDRRPNFNPEAA